MGVDEAVNGRHADDSLAHSNLDNLYTLWRLFGASDCAVAANAGGKIWHSHSWPHRVWCEAPSVQALAALRALPVADARLLQLPHWGAGIDAANALAQQQLVSYGVEDYVRSIQAYVNSLPVTPILIGHSMGALISQLVAARTNVEALVLISSAPPAGVNGWSWSVMRAFGRNLFLFPLWKKVTQIGIDNVRYGIANTETNSVQEELARDATYESGRASFEIGMPFLFRRPPTKVNTQAINCPVLMLGGTEDRITPIGIQRKTAELYQGRARLIELPGVCHWTVGGNALPLVKQHILKWLKQQGIELPVQSAA